MNRNKNTKSNTNAVGANCVHSQNSRGITLVALIITIIVMLILVAVSVTIAIKGDLFGTTKRAAKGTEKAKNIEQELANGRVKIDNVWYDSLEDYVGGKPSEDQKESKISFEYEPKVWTKGPVIVKIKAQEIEGTLQYSMDEITWTNYAGEAIEVENSGTKIYARVMGSDEKEETVIEKIDKEAPSITVALNSPSQTTTSINIEIGAKDSISGISKIEWYYKNSSETEGKYTSLTEDKYAEINGENAGNRNEIKAEKTISGLEKGTTYNIKVVIYDVAGNKTESIVEAQTMASLVGKSATIDGQKYIVLYEPGEKIEIDGEEHEIKDAQLISANALEPYKVHLGYRDGQVDWGNGDVISEADLDKNNTLNNEEKSIYSYNHAVETLNEKCRNIVDGNLSGAKEDVVGVRSVGSLPLFPDLDESAPCSTVDLSWLLKEFPSATLKDTDSSFSLDYNRLESIGATTADNREWYWLASRFVRDGEGVGAPSFRIRCGHDAEGEFIVARDGAVGIWANSYNFGVRPVISLEANSLTKYLD